jgi:hypothetical protein
MKASVVTAYGGPEVMKYQDMPESDKVQVNGSAVCAGARGRSR